MAFLISIRRWLPSNCYSSLGSSISDLWNKRVQSPTRRRDIPSSCCLASQQLDKDLILIKDVPAPSLDPSIPYSGLGAVAGFDCTKPMKRDAPPVFPPVSKIPYSELDNFDITKYVSAESLSEILKEEK